MIQIITILLSAQLWRMGGHGMKWARAIGVTALIAVAKAIISQNWWALGYAPLLWGMMSLFSYGVSAPPHKFWVMVFGKGDDGNYKPVEIITRATCGLFWSLPAVLFAIIGGSWLMFAVYCIVLTVANGLIGGFVKDVEISERGVGAVVSLSVFV